MPSRSLFSGCASGFPPVVTTPASYAGPGDILSGATGWWGLRAYSAATIGASAVRLRRDSDSTESDFVTLSNGSLDVASITTFKGAANLFVVKLYDQTGNGFHLLQATAGSQLSFFLATLGSFAAMYGNGTKSMATAVAAGLASSQPVSYSTVLNHDNMGTAGGYYLSDSGGALGCLADFGINNTLAMGAPSPFIRNTAASATWHAAQNIFNGASSNICVNGTDNIANAGASGPDTQFLIYSSFQPLAGYMMEMGYWKSDISSVRLALNSNQHTYWGF